MSQTFDAATTLLPHGIHAIEASAGTGKTHTLAQLVVRLVGEMGLAIDEILVVTFTRAAAAELRERIFRHLSEAEIAARQADPSSALARQLLAAKVRMDLATIATIDGFVAQVARELGWAVGIASDAELITDEAEIDLPIIDALWQASAALPPPLQEAVLRHWPTPDKLYDTLIRIGSRAYFTQPYDWPTTLTRWLKANDQPKHGAPEAGEVPNDDQIMQAWLREQYQRWQAERRAALARRNGYTYASLKEAIADALATYPMLVRTLRARYRACLIDEFQDTDPDQWRLFAPLFAPLPDATDEPPRWLFLIGDPKQAIYGFRGANLETYFAAVATAHYHHTLTVNYRSHPTLIDGFNTLFAEPEGHHPLRTPFLDPRCRYHPVRAGRTASERPFSWGGQDGARIRLVTSAAPKEESEAILLEQLAHDVVSVLTTGQIDGTPVMPNQIAILTRSNEQAFQVQRKLRQAGVPSVLTSRRSVWVSESAIALIALLKSLTAPHETALLRAVLHGPLFQWPPERLADEAAITRAATLWRETRQRWERSGLLPALLPLFAEMGVWSRLAHLPDGDRRLADTRHLLELLHEASRHHASRPEQLLRWAIATHHAAPNEATLRLERDDQAVVILTMHSSKGLQFPIVFLWGAWGSDNTQSAPYPLVFPTPDGRRLTFDKAEKEAYQKMAQQELRRLFYVGCTRAECHLTIYLPLAKCSDPTRNPLAALIMPRLALLTNHPAFWRETADKQPPCPRWQPATQPATLRAPLPLATDQVWHRTQRQTSFTALVRSVAAERSTPLTAETGWLDDEAERHQLAADDLPAGPTFGLLVHSFFEAIDFTAPDWALLDQLWTRYGFGPPPAPPALKAMLENTLAANCPPVPLAQLVRSATTREHPFLLHTPAIDPARLNALLESLIAPLPEPARAAWQPLTASQVRGFLEGVIDLVACHNGRYALFDYKTNRLPSYDQVSLAETMVAHHYLLQGLLYALAWDAHLRHLLPDYRPEADLPDVHFLFVRGMATGKEQGIFTCRFSPATLAAARQALGIADGADR